MDTRLNKIYMNTHTLMLIFKRETIFKSYHYVCVCARIFLFGVVSNKVFLFYIINSTVE